jgi:hypothetical protein
VLLAAAGLYMAAWHWRMRGAAAARGIAA